MHLIHQSSPNTGIHAGSLGIEKVKAFKISFLNLLKNVRNETKF